MCHKQRMLISNDGYTCVVREKSKKPGAWDNSLTIMATIDGNDGDEQQVAIEIMYTERGVEIEVTQTNDEFNEFAEHFIHEKNGPVYFLGNNTKE
jgi:hypothetical protein